MRLSGSRRKQRVARYAHWPEESRRPRRPRQRGEGEPRAYSPCAAPAVQEAGTPLLCGHWTSLAGVSSNPEAGCLPPLQRGVYLPFGWRHGLTEAQSAKSRAAIGRLRCVPSQPPNGVPPKTESSN